MVQISDRPTKAEQYFTHAGMTWDEFKLDGEQYVPIQHSGWVPEVDLQHLAQCAAIERRKDAIKAWNKSEG